MSVKFAAKNLPGPVPVIIILKCITQIWGRTRVNTARWLSNDGEFLFWFYFKPVFYDSYKQFHTEILSFSILKKITVQQNQRFFTNSNRYITKKQFS